ncbi:hypothetical protein Aduo_015556 [Ancylostoma duodenale]
MRDGLDENWICVRCPTAAVAIIVALFGAAMIVRDINHMRSEIETSMKEVKVVADDAWERLMMTQFSSGNGEKKATFRTLFGRNKRQAQCQCGTQQRGCPAGPPGPPGQPGGYDEPQVDSGKPGAPGISLAVTQDIPGGCIKCPPGPPGQPGGPGNQGPSRQPGGAGPMGPPGNDGGAETPGPIGDPGPTGLPGSPGPPGRPGQNAESSAPGRSGGSGPPEPLGPPGPPGGPNGSGGPENNGFQEMTELLGT